MDTTKITDEIKKLESELKESIKMRNKLIDHLNRVDKVIHGHIGALRTLNDLIEKELDGA
jgi:hypothetical protein|tara:strand:+ start:56 stop:235 length:180 start_codon:yes stop_codon:yes gene_type:complete